MKRTLFIIATVLAISFGSYKSIQAGIADYNAKSLSLFRASDLYVRNQVVLLNSEQGSCTGVQVVAPSGHVYILTASHCKSLLVSNSMRTTTEGGVTSMSSFIKEDGVSDLMLLSSNISTGVFIAADNYPHQHVHTLTHGHGFPTYRTDGELLRIDRVQVILFEANESNMSECSNMPKLELIGAPGLGMYCIMSTYQMMTTAAITPGSSGGPILDASGSLVGIASATNGNFSAFVTLKDIQNFLSDY